jgi:hypothetical protein
LDYSPHAQCHKPWTPSSLFWDRGVGHVPNLDGGRINQARFWTKSAAGLERQGDEVGTPNSTWIIRFLANPPLHLLQSRPWIEQHHPNAATTAFYVVRQRLFREFEFPIL